MGEGGQAKVFKAKFHGKYVAMKYIPLDKLHREYKYSFTSYGCHEFFSLKNKWNNEQTNEGSQLAYFFCRKDCPVTKNTYFGMFIIMPLFRESLRQMMDLGRVDHSVKIHVLKKLKNVACHSHENHGDIKDCPVWN